MGETVKPTANGVRRFLLVRDDFYSDPEEVRRIAQSMKFEETGDITGFMTSEVYHPAGVRRRLERVLGVKITRWDADPDRGNGIFYQAFSRGSQKETPGVHSDEPYEDITVLIYLTPGLPIDCGTSLWQHRAALGVAPLRIEPARRAHLPDIPDRRGLVELPALRLILSGQRHHDDMGRDAGAERECVPGSRRGRAAHEIDLDVAEFEKDMIERIDRLVHRLLGGEEKFALQRIVGNAAQLLRRGNQFEHFRRQRHGGLDVDPDRADIALQANSSHGDPIVVSQ